MICLVSKSAMAILLFAKIVGYVIFSWWVVIEISILLSLLWFVLDQASLAEEGNLLLSKTGKWIISVFIFIIFCIGYLYLKMGYVLPEGRVFSSSRLQTGLFITVMLILAFTVYANGTAAGFPKKGTALISVGLLIVSVAIALF